MFPLPIPHQSLANTTTYNRFPSTTISRAEWAASEKLTKYPAMVNPCHDSGGSEKTPGQNYRKALISGGWESEGGKRRTATGETKTGRKRTSNHICASGKRENLTLSAWDWSSRAECRHSGFGVIGATECVQCQWRGVEPRSLQSLSVL